MNYKWILSISLIFVLHLIASQVVQAQAQVVTGDNESERSKITYHQQHSNTLNELQGLFADGVTLKLDLSVLDSEEEEIDYSAIPADDLYGGIWDNKGFGSYTNLENLPDSFMLDLTHYTMPCAGRMTSNFGQRGRYRYHYGVDLKAQTGDTIYAAFDGKVRVCEYERRGYGYYVIIRHRNGLETTYGHLSKFLVDINDYVQTGQPIALAGSTGRSTGSHLHFETRMLGKVIDPNLLIDFANHVPHKDEYLVTKSSFNKSRRSSRSVVYSDMANYQLSKKPATQSLVAHAKVESATQQEGIEPQYHTIKSGDTLIEIAKKYGVSVSKICSLNNISTRTVLRIGKVLRVS